MLGNICATIIALAFISLCWHGCDLEHSEKMERLKKNPICQEISK